VNFERLLRSTYFLKEPWFMIPVFEQALLLELDSNLTFSFIGLPPLQHLELLVLTYQAQSLELG
jgi:hypothetical protein